MVTTLPGACRASDFYAALDPKRSAPEARALILAAYSDRELPGDQAAKVESHLASCPSCARFVQELEGASGPVEVAVAVCPSSESLDRYLFERSSVPPTESARIERHLKECPLCLEETEWLRDVEEPAAIPFRAQTPAWVRPVLAAAAVIILALAAALFWRGGSGPTNEEKLQALAVIKEPSQIDFPELELTSAPLDDAVRGEYEAAVADFKAGRYPDAGRKLEDVLAREPKHSGAVFLLGYSYYKMNQPERAYELCDRAEGMTPHAYERCMFLVNIALKTGNFRRALLEISALYHSAPQDPRIRDMYEKITALMPAPKQI